MKRWWWVLVVLALAGVVVWQVRSRQEATDAAAQWQTEVIRRGTLEATVAASGTVRAAQSATLAWQISGVVDNVNAALGDHVSQDQTLATLREDSWPQTLLQARASLLSAQKQLQDLQESAELQYARALQQLATAQRQLDRAQNHYDWLVDLTENDDEDDDPSDLDMQEAEANLAVAKAQVAQAQREVERWKDGPPEDQVAILQAQIEAAQATLSLASLTAPFDGVISDRRVDPGNLVSPGTLAFRLDDLGTLYVDVDLSELDVASVSVGQPAVLAFDALAGHTYHGTVTAVALAGTPDRTGRSVSFRVTVELTDADQLVRPGMTAAVTIQTEKIEDALLVPSRAVRVRDGEPVVFVLENGTPQPKPVTLGAISGDYAQVLSGDVEEGDEVVLNPPAESFNLFGGK